ncbi:MAG: DUF4861 family protein [Paludibacteraceae bacterium]|nr:DUF4861 family protein [Paludibacteraceae bacterium]
MKRFILVLCTVLGLVSCSKAVEITVYNKLPFSRNNEMVEFCLCSLEHKLSMKEGDKIIILDKDNKKVPYQILSDTKTVIFPVSVAAKDSVKYRVLIGKPDSVAPKTFGRKVPERKDDFAWESDRIAFRMYGPALAPENPSDGVDVWLKRTEDLVVNRFYKDDLEKGIHYHIDHGQGLDCYKVAHTLGAGGIAPYVDKTLWVGNHYNKAEVIENGPLRTVFKLTYDTVRVGKKTVKETLLVSIDAGSQLNKATVVYEGEGRASMPVAAGIFLHDSIGVIKLAKDRFYIGYAEKATSDAGVPSGRSYVGVVIPTKINEAKQEGKHIIAVADYKSDRPFEYYFGAGWSKWGFASDQDWFNYLDQFAQKLRSPLEVYVR